jgi:pimeloyl-ACP methyl ester carboxylesterase
VDHQGQRVSALDRIEAIERIPSLIVWGDRDRIVPADQGRRVHEQVPHTELAVFRGAGHFPHRDDPARFVRTLDAFLGAQRAASARPKRAAASA